MTNGLTGERLLLDAAILERVVDESTRIFSGTRLRAEVASVETVVEMATCLTGERLFDDEAALLELAAASTRFLGRGRPLVEA